MFQIIFNIVVIIWLIYATIKPGRVGPQGFKGEKGDKGETVYVEVKNDK